MTKKWKIGIGVFVVCCALGAILDNNEKKTKPQPIEQTEQKENKEVEQKSSKPVEQTEQKQESVKEEAPKKEINPLENFIGTYNLYDNDGHTGNDIIVANDGRFFYKSNGDIGNKLCGKVKPISEKVFSVFLKEEFYGFGNKQVWSYRNGSTATLRWDVNFGKILVFDFTDNKMYIDKEEYDNRDYTSPEYYQFRFRKN